MKPYRTFVISKSKFDKQRQYKFPGRRAMEANRAIAAATGIELRSLFEYTSERRGVNGSVLVLLMDLFDCGPHDLVTEAENVNG